MRQIHRTTHTTPAGGMPPITRGTRFPAVLAKSSPRQQRGYLIEIPIMMMAILVATALIIPKLPPLGQKIAIVLAAIPILFGLFYMIVIPGWTPNADKRLKPPWNWLLFIIIAIPIVAVVVMLITDVIQTLIR